MAEKGFKRKLAAILRTDAKYCSRLVTDSKEPDLPIWCLMTLGVEAITKPFLNEKHFAKVKLLL